MLYLIKIEECTDRLIAAERIEIKHLSPYGKVAWNRDLWSADIAALLHHSLKLRSIDALPPLKERDMSLKEIGRSHRGKQSPYRGDSNAL